MCSRCLQNNCVSLLILLEEKEDLAVAQNDLGLPKHVLTTEMPTSWGSRQMMIQRLLEHERAISQVLKADKKSRHLVLCQQKVDVLEAVNNVLSRLQTNFPRIAKLARQYLCIPAISAPSEKAFSTGGNTVTCHRATLKPDAVNRLVFLAQNV